MPMGCLRSTPRLRGAGRILVGVMSVTLLASCASSSERAIRRSLSVTERTYQFPSLTGERVTLSDEGTPLPDSADLYGLLRYAAQNNAGLQAAFARWQAATARIPQAKSLPDPRFNFGYFFSEVETRVGPQRQRFGLSQMFPWFGTLRLKGDIAAQNALIAQERFVAAQDRLYLEVVSAHTEHYYLARSIAITTELIELVKNAESVTQAKYRAAIGSYADMLRAQVELGRLEDRLIALQDQEKPVVARVNAALNRPLDAPLPRPLDLPDESVALSDEELLNQAARNNPNLRAIDRVIDREEHAIDLAGRKYYPSFTIGIDYVNTDVALMPDVVDSGKDPLMGRVAINIPIWWGSYDAGRREAQARRRAAALDRIEQQNQVLAGMHEVLFAYHDDVRKISLYRDALIPKAEQSLRASQTGYEAGEVDFLDFLDAERVLLEFELAYDRARANQLKHLAHLRMLTGGALAETADELR